MLFRDWKVDDLIEYLKDMKLSSMFDYNRVIRVSGEITARNGEPNKSLEPPKEEENDRKIFG